MLALFDIRTLLLTTTLVNLLIATRLLPNGVGLATRSRPGETTFTAAIPFETRETLDERT